MSEGALKFGKQPQFLTVTVLERSSAIAALLFPLWIYPIAAHNTVK